MSFTLAELLQQPILELSFPGAPGHAKNGNWKPKATDSRTACTGALLIISFGCGSKLTLAKDRTLSQGASS